MSTQRTLYPRMKQQKRLLVTQELTFIPIASHRNITRRKRTLDLKERLHNRRLMMHQPVANPHVHHKNIRR